MNTNNSSGDCMADDNKVFAFENSRVFFFLVLYTILLPMPPMFSRTKDFFWQDSLPTDGAGRTT